MTRIGPLVALGLVLGCGQSKTPPDAGAIDPSCGIDCAAQRSYGLLVNRCFEYSVNPSADTPADLGALVLPVETLEGGVKAIPVQYLQSGQIRMTDHFILPNGDLLLARREFLPGQSVTYEDANKSIVGATWLKAQGIPGQIYTSTPTADVINNAGRTYDATTYTVNTTAAGASELSVPAGAFDAGTKLIFNESPDHGADPRRIYSLGVGLVSFSSYFSPTPTGAAQAFNLQKIRDIDPDGGSTECGLGGP